MEKTEVIGQLLEKGGKEDERKGGRKTNWSLGREEV
jgi:hypothetical protein